MKLRFTRMSEERGAVLPIVAVCLIAFFGMVVLTVDVGGLLTKRRSMVNASDAAALAAARSFAGGDSECGLDEVDAQSQANLLATSNVAGASLTAPAGWSTECLAQSSGKVTVVYEDEQDVFFAPILGSPDQTMVRARAVATWGPLAGGNAVPIVLEAGQLQGVCDVPNVGDEATCDFWYDSNDLGNADWGFMNLDQWDVEPTETCYNAGASDRSDWIFNGYPTLLDMSTSPTYVCVDTGHTSRDWQDLADEEGEVKLFPVNDCGAQLDRDGVPTGCDGTPDKYAIVGFTALLVEKVYKGNDPEAIGTPGDSGSCNRNNVDIGTGEIWNLDAFGVANGCFSSAPDAIDGLTIDPQGSGSYRGCDATDGVPDSYPTCDYVYDLANRQFQWLAPSADDARISIDWSNQGTAGACGARPSDPNAICLITKWQGFTPFPGTMCDPSTDPSCIDFGARAIRLIE